jgi:hypothetical protein
MAVVVAFALSASCGGSTASSKGFEVDAASAQDWSHTGSTEDSSAANRFPCVDPAPLVIGGKDTGYDTCQGARLRRRIVVDCPNLMANLPSASCGFCSSGCFCTSGCTRDSDCSSGQICVCADPVGHCVDSSCNAGKCAPGFDCIDYDISPGCPGSAFACQTPADACLTDSDCGAGANCTGADSPHEIETGAGRVCSQGWCYPI